MKSIMKIICKNFFLLLAGGMIYSCIELLYRGHTHWTMIMVGGMSFLFCGSVNEFLNWDMLIWKQMLICAVGITVIEFISGYVLNIVLQLDIWDYSRIPFNLLGQICLPFSVAWYILSLPAIILDDYMRHWMFGEEKPKYRWR